MMPHHKSNPTDVVHQAHPTSEYHDLMKDKQAMALLAFSHTPIEHRLYQAMLAETTAAQTRSGQFSVRRLMLLTGLNSYSTIRRARTGLISKLSIGCQESVSNGNSTGQPQVVYSVFTPEEIFARRRAAGLKPYLKDVQAYDSSSIFGSIIERLVDRHDLSRREAQVALCCAEGLTNAQIGERLFISEQTVKFHLRHIFIKFNVKRRAELVARLLTQRESGEAKSLEQT